MNVAPTLPPEVAALGPDERCAACATGPAYRCLGCAIRHYCALALAEAAAGKSDAYRRRIAARSAEPGPVEAPPAASPRPVLARAPYADDDVYVAPLRGDARGAPLPWSARPWEGSAPRKPWQYRVVAGIAHLDQPDLLAAVLDTLRGQSERPYLHVVDTGSTAAVRARLAALARESDDLQVDYLRPRGHPQTSMPVAVAMDLVFASVGPGVPYVYSTHVDVFAKRPDYLAYLAARCDAATPVVGYQMSPRRGWRDDLWARIPSHTATLYHMPTMRRIRARWSMVAAGERLHLDPARYFDAAFPDTETCLGLDLIDAGIGMRWLAPDGSDPDRPRPGDPPSWLCLGPEPNEPYETPWLRHERSYTAHAVYAPDHAATRAGALARAVAESRARVASWAPVRPVAAPEPDRPAVPLPDWPAAWRASGGRLADCGHGVYVGDKAACDRHGGRFRRTIHLWHPKGGAETPCAGLDGGLEVRYLEGAPLGTASVAAEDVILYARGDGALLVHCHAGHTRGPDFAVLALAARGVPVPEAEEQVRRATASYGIPDSGSDAVRAEVRALFAAGVPAPTIAPAESAAIGSCPHHGTEVGCCDDRRDVCGKGRNRGGRWWTEDCLRCVRLAGNIENFG